RLVGSTMAKFEFERFAAECLPQNLMAEANSENRCAAVHQFLYFFDDVGEGGWVARAVGEKNSGGFVFQNFGCRGGRRNDMNFETTLAEAPEDVVFHPEVVSDDGNVGGAQRFAQILC